MLRSPSRSARAAATPSAAARPTGERVGGARAHWPSRERVERHVAVAGRRVGGLSRRLRQWERGKEAGVWAGAAGEGARMIAR